MAQIKAILARGLLDEIAQSAIASGSDLIEAIRTAKTAQNSTSFKQGRIYTSTSGSGQSHSFQTPVMYTAGYTPIEIAAQYQEYIEIYNDCVTAGLITDATNTAADLQTMLNDDRLQTVTEMRNDYTGLRFPGTSLSGI